MVGLETNEKIIEGCTMNDKDQLKLLSWLWFWFDCPTLSPRPRWWWCDADIFVRHCCCGTCTFLPQQIGVCLIVLPAADTTCEAMVTSVNDETKTTIIARVSFIDLLYSFIFVDWCNRVGQIDSIESTMIPFFDNKIDRFDCVSLRCFRLFS